MTTSATTFILSKPTGRNKISGATSAYMQTRNRLRAFNVVHAELKKSGLSRAELADRTGKGADRIAHLLGAPGNWTLDTMSNLLFAISGAEIDYQISYPFDQKPRNQTRPSWLFAEFKPAFAQKSSIPPTTMSMSSVNDVGSSPFSLTYTGTYSEPKDVKKPLGKVMV